MHDHPRWGQQLRRFKPFALRSQFCGYKNFVVVSSAQQLKKSGSKVEVRLSQNSCAYLEFCLETASE